jgi:hypothetical protein
VEERLSPVQAVHPAPEKGSAEVKQIVQHTYLNEDGKTEKQTGITAEFCENDWQAYPGGSCIGSAGHSLQKN